MALGFGYEHLAWQPLLVAPVRACFIAFHAIATISIVMDVLMPTFVGKRLFISMYMSNTH